ncbi:hypothetical protein [Clostridium perfringens]|uniref:hypothetical protein n=1 Tax=Clostridium perfringens TaxID=1502 RepID=UPI0018E4D2C8|nr:hypothetical protein [Clostridium perfringens]MDV5090579.1 hypothetical protein [Clostridium perfringens]MDV5108629.1 hypothetical protein [Clostridium perfringens]
MINKLFLDLNNFKPNLGSVERGDSIELNIKLLNDEDYSRSKFRLLGAKSDGKSVEQIEGLNLEDKDLKVVLEDQFVNCEGIVKLELNVVSGETEITTKEFYFFVSNTMNAEIIDSADSIPTLEKVSKYVDDAVNNLDALKEASADIALINGEFKENEIKRKANEMLREKNEKSRLQSEDIRITEEEEREANELERIQAENDRKVDESNRKLAENTRVTNERAREEAELSRQSTFEENEEIRNSNENLRIASEKERIKFNNKAKTDEVNRKEAETKRVEAEKTRVIAEDERKKAETSRQEAEDIRQNTYTNFNEAEEERRNNEISRQEAEALRIEAEKRRDDLYSQKEEERNAAFLESERTRERAFNEAQFNRNEAYEESERVREEAFKVSEATRNEEEEGRAEAEVLRVEAEKLRVAGEENRNNTFTQSEEERKATFEEAENARKVAESKRAKAESSRVEAEKLRVSTETGRVEAESLRVTAEEERVAAEAKRDEKIKELESKVDNIGNNSSNEEIINARSATTGEVFNTLDERIDHEVDRLNKKIDVTMLQQEDKENHTIENSVEGLTTYMVIRGKTLVNLLKDKIDFISSSNSPHTGQKNLVFATRPNKPFTFIADIKYTGSLPTQLFVRGNKTDSTFVEFGSVEITSNLNGKIVCVCKQNIDKGCSSVLIGFRSNNDNSTIKNAMILEGDWTNKPIPQYFEGVKTFGQKEGKISGLSIGKNIFTGFDMQKFTNSNSQTKINSPHSITVGGQQATFYELQLPAKKDFILSFKHKGSYQLIRWYNTEGAMKGSDIGNKVKINTEDGYVKLGFFVGSPYASSESTYYDIQIEEGTNSTYFEPYKEDKKDILLSELGFDEGLRGINGVSDELNSIRNVAIKRIGKREYREGDLLLDNVITDKVNTYYVLEEPIETSFNENINVKIFSEKNYISFKNAISGTSSFKAPVNAAATISRLNRENRALEEENKNLRQDFESTTLTLTDSDLELVKQNVDMDFRLMEVEFALDIPQAILSSNIKFKNKKGEVKSMARTPYEMMKIVILSGDYDREDYMHKVGKYYERRRMTKEEHDELMSLMTADEVISK